MEDLITKREIGPLLGFRSKMGRLFNANIKLTDELEMKFDFGNDDGGAEEVDFSGQESLGKCPKCSSAVFEHGMSYVCEKAVGATRACNFRTGKIILKRPIEREQVVKLLRTGKTDLLPKFISKKGRPFSAYLVAGADGKVGFEFEPRKTKAAATTETAAEPVAEKTKTPAKKTTARKATKR
jgi:DNA topoisomerase-3